MDVKTGFKIIDNILATGFKKDELVVFLAKAPEVNWLETIRQRWPQAKQIPYYYGLHYKFNGIDNINYFKNSKELQFWYKLHEIYRKNKQQVTEIINLYIWDNEIGPVIVDDILPHIQHTTNNV